MVNEMQRAAMSTRLGIPMIYGIDAVHGHGNVYKATVFPHNVGLGCTRSCTDPGKFLGGLNYKAIYPQFHIKPP
jgi:beta-glucosidase-like glycosyl hydrolase